MTDDILTAEFFSGCGGLSTGFERGGFDVVFANDIDQNSLDTYGANHEDVATYCADVRNVDGATVEQEVQQNVDDSITLNDIDAVIGGPPCEGFSIAGDRDTEDPRNQLFRHYFDVVSEIDPEVVVMENVEGILSMEINGENAASLVKSELQDMGYQIETHWKLDASHYGVPQKRVRVFFVGARDTTVSSPPTETADSPVTVWEALSDLPRLSPGEEKTTHENDPWTAYQRSMREHADRDDDGNERLYNHKAYNHGARTVARFELTPHGENYVEIPDKEEFDDYVPSSTYNSRHNKLEPHKPSGTVTSHCNDEMVHYNDSRVITVREAARLQSFPDEYKFHGERSNGHGTDPENQYEQVGNAVPPRLAHSIARHIRRVVFEGVDVTTDSTNKESLEDWT